MNRNLIPVQNKTLTTASVSFIPFRWMKDKKDVFPPFRGYILSLISSSRFFLQEDILQNKEYRKYIHQNTYFFLFYLSSNQI